MMATIYSEIKTLKNKIDRMRLKLKIMEATLNQLEIIVNRKRTRHGEPLADKIAKMIMNHPKKKASQREILRRFTDKRLGDIIMLQEILQSKYNIKAFADSRRKIIYYYEKPEIKEIKKMKLRQIKKELELLNAKKVNK